MKERQHQCLRQAEFEFFSKSLSESNSVQTCLETQTGLSWCIWDNLFKTIDESRLVITTATGTSTKCESHQQLAHQAISIISYLDYT